MSLVQIIGLSLVELIGDFGAKQFANLGGIKNLGIGIIGYIGVFLSLIINFQGSSILMVNTAWDGVSTIIGALFGFFVLKERFESWTQYLGIPIIILGMFLLKIPITKSLPFKFPDL